MGSDNPLPKGGRLKARSRIQLFRGIVTLVAVGVLLYVTSEVPPESEKAAASLGGEELGHAVAHDPDSHVARRWVVRSKRAMEGKAAELGVGGSLEQARREAISVEEVRSVEAALASVEAAQKAGVGLSQHKGPEPKGLYALTATNIKVSPVPKKKTKPMCCTMS